jgi:hypothetical protein
MSVTTALLWLALFVALIVGMQALGFRPRSRAESYPVAALIVGGIVAASIVVQLWDNDRGGLAFLVAVAYVGLVIFLWPRLLRR